MAVNSSNSDSALKRRLGPFVFYDALDDGPLNAPVQDRPADDQAGRADETENIGKGSRLVEFRLNFCRRHVAGQSDRVDADAGGDTFNGPSIGDEGHPHEPAMEGLLQTLAGRRNRGPRGKLRGWTENGQLVLNEAHLVGLCGKYRFQVALENAAVRAQKFAEIGDRNDGGL